MSFVLLGILNAQAAGGGAGALAYDHLDTTTASTGVTEVNFTGLSAYSDYKHLQIRINAKLNFNIGDDAYNIWVQFNGDTGSNYSYHELFNGASSLGVNQEAINLTDITPSSSISNLWGAGVLDILDFANPNRNTTIRSLHGFANDNVVRSSLVGGAWYNTNAVTSIKLKTPAFSYLGPSTFSLYGIKG